MAIIRPTQFDSPESEQHQTQRRSLYRAVIQFFASNLGLVIIVTAYSVGGAYLFILLEEYIESQNCLLGSLNENISVTSLSEGIYNYIAVTTDNTTVIYATMVEYLTNFTDEIYERRSDYLYVGQDCASTTRWTFSSALLFTITIITSIGFGHVTPISWEGQITCICYALIGIPLFLICLTNISSVLSNIFRIIYSTLLDCLCCCCRINGRHNQSQNHSGHSRSSLDKNQTNYVGTTVSIDPSWPEANDAFYQDQFNEHANDEATKHWNGIPYDVPIFIVLLIIVGYIFFGAFIFSRFEDWTMLESVYFCYIALSSIGFGDYVPGITSDTFNGLHFLVTSVYIIVGLAILAMCFDVMKESIVDKLIWLGDHIGMTNVTDDEIDENDVSYSATTSPEHALIKI